MQCERCETPISGSSRKKYCEVCKPIVRAEQRLANQRAKSQARKDQHFCCDCGTKIENLRTPRCEPCHTEHQRAKWRQFYYDHREDLLEKQRHRRATSHECVICGVLLDAYRKKYCDPCRKNVDRQNSRDSYARHRDKILAKLRSDPNKTEKSRARYAKHRDQIRATRRKHYAANREQYVQKMRDYREKHPERIRETSKRYHEKHREKLILKTREWRIENRQYTRAFDRRRYHGDPERRENVRISVKRYIQRNPEQYRAKLLAHAHRRRSAEGKFTPDQWIWLLDVTGHQCLCCGATEIKLTVDHVIPLSRGGTNWIHNLQPLCWECNFKKFTKTIDYRPPDLVNQLTQELP